MRLVMTARGQRWGLAAPPVALAALSCLVSACTRQNPAYRGAPGSSRDALVGVRPTLDARVQSADAGPEDRDAPSSAALDTRLMSPDGPFDVAATKAIVLTASNPTGRYGKYVSIHTELCPGDQVLGGYTGTVGTYGGPLVVSGLDAECREIIVGSGQPATVTLAAGGLVQEFPGVLAAHVAFGGIKTQQMVVFDGDASRDEALGRMRTKDVGPAVVPSVQRQVHRRGVGRHVRVVGGRGRRPGHRRRVPRLVAADKSGSGA